MLSQSSFSTLPAILWAILLIQGHAVTALPLGLNPTAPLAITTPLTNHDTLPWLITRGLQFLPTEIHKDANSNPSTTPASTTHLRFPSVVAQSQPRRSTRNIPRQLLRRADNLLTNRTFLTAMFALLIAVPVLLGLAIASIAVFGFDWKGYLRKSPAREETEKDMEKEALGAR